MNQGFSAPFFQKPWVEWDAAHDQFTENPPMIAELALSTLKHRSSLDLSQQNLTIARNAFVVARRSDYLSSLYGWFDSHKRFIALVIKGAIPLSPDDQGFEQDFVQHFKASEPTQEVYRHIHEDSWGDNNFEAEINASYMAHRDAYRRPGGDDVSRAFFRIFLIKLSALNDECAKEAPYTHETIGFLRNMAHILRELDDPDAYHNRLYDSGTMALAKKVGDSLPRAVFSVEGSSSSWQLLETLSKK